MVTNTYISVTSEIGKYACSNGSMYSFNRCHTEEVEVQPVCGCDPLRDSDCEWGKPRRWDWEPLLGCWWISLFCSDRRRIDCSNSLSSSRVGWDKCLSLDMEELRGGKPGPPGGRTVW